jgi:uncharacterized protein (TIGR01777 family)
LNDRFDKDSAIGLVTARQALLVYGGDHAKLRFAEAEVYLFCHPFEKRRSIMAYLVTGGTGFVGRMLIQQLLAETDKSVYVTSRNSRKVSEQFRDPRVIGISWDPISQPLLLNEEALHATGLTAVFNLMGESVAGGRWTSVKKERIRNSRMDGTRNLVDGLVQSQLLPQLMVSASAVGIYGDRGDQLITEDSPIQIEQGNRFLIDVCQQWEAQADRLADQGVRVVKVRIGIVLGLDGGALEQMIPIFRMGGGGRLGSGKQWVPWIHQVDLIRLFRWLETETVLTGVVNGTAPNPIQNQQMTRDIASVLRRPALLPVPAFALKVTLGEFSDELLTSKRVVPARALAEGFHFRFSDFRGALEDLLGTGR